jgi:hypothetical protein
MEGFYTKQEAARLLGISVRQINNYFTERKLSRVIRGNKAWIPKAEVRHLYDRAKKGPLLQQEDLLDLMDRVDDLVQQVETLKLGLGYGSKRPLRGEDELLLLRQRVLDSMTKQVWDRKWMSEIADQLMGMQAEEISILAESCGPSAWIPLCDLSYRMLSYIETHPEYPGRGLDVLETRLIRARDRFFGLVHSTTKVDMGMSQRQAERVYESLQVPPNGIEMHVVEYLSS